MFCCGSAGELEGNLRGEILFLNVVIVDKSDAVKSAVSARVEEKLGRGFLANRIKMRAVEFANKIVSDDQVAAVMSDRMCQFIPEKMMELGIRSETKLVFNKGSFFVCRITIKDVNMRTLLAKKMEDEDHASVCLCDIFDSFAKALGGKEAIDKTFTQFIANRLQVVMPVRMKEVMDAKGMVCDIAVKTKEDEAMFFFDIVSPDSDDSGGTALEYL